jgi:hypothetical protein
VLLLPRSIHRVTEILERLALSVAHFSLTLSSRTPGSRCEAKWVSGRGNKTRIVHSSSLSPNCSDLLLSFGACMQVIPRGITLSHVIPSLPLREHHNRITFGPLSFISYSPCFRFFFTHTPTIFSFLWMIGLAIPTCESSIASRCPDYIPRAASQCPGSLGWALRTRVLPVVCVTRA